MEVNDPGEDKRKSQEKRDDINVRRRKVYAEKKKKKQDMETVPVETDVPKDKNEATQKQEIKKARRRQLYAEKKNNKQYMQGVTDINVQTTNRSTYEIGSTSGGLSPCDQCLVVPTNHVRLIDNSPAIRHEPLLLHRVPSCKHCHAKRFPFEPKGFCCCEGQVKLYENQIPETLLLLYNSNNAQSVDFRQHIRAYNNAFCFTSFGVVLDTECTSQHSGIYTFRAQGQVYHHINSIYPSEKKPAFLQLYFYDTENEVANRASYAPNLFSHTIEDVISILHPNPYSVFFRSLIDIPELETHEIRLRADPKIDTGTLSSPTASQVAAIWRENEHSSILREREITVLQHDGHSQRIRYYFGCYDPLQYPLLFPLGEPGWHQGLKRIPRKDVGRLDSLSPLASYVFPSTADQMLAAETQDLEENSHKDNTVSAREFYAYRFQIRPTINTILLRSGRLLQQFAVDMYVKIESSRLDYFRHKQNEIRAELYQGIVDSIAQGESRGSKVGKRIILPGSFIGGPRDMRKRYLDAMTLVERYGKPDIFLPMTCNPTWPEISSELHTHDLAQNRPDLVTRVFRSKVEQLKKEVIKKELFGPVAAYTYVIEFQKRGLPHMHMLIILKTSFKLNTVEKFDTHISAELPDVKLYPHLYTMVVRHMMHGPCGDINPTNVCMRLKDCKNHFPKSFTAETRISNDGYPVYRRRKDNRKAMVRGHILDNRWVVPYNPYLLSLFDCHLNVEVCSTIKAVKYLYKYMYKGHDKVIFQIVNQNKRDEIDEITQFQSARWVSPPEALWRIYRFSLHDMYPSVTSLQLHLPDCQIVGFRKDTSINYIANADYFSKTMLTQFFYMNQHNEHAKAGRYLYREFPTYFVWNKKGRTWSRRKNRSVIGRVITANPTEGERYYLRLLLTHVRCPTSYCDLRTLCGSTYNTFREAALAYGLLSDDQSNEKCLTEASLYQMPTSLRNLFCTILTFCNPVDPRRLFLTFEDSMIDDLTNLQKMTRLLARQTLLDILKTLMETLGKNIRDFNLSDLFVSSETRTVACKAILDEQNLEVPIADLQSIAQLNGEQRHAFNEITNAVAAKESRSFFIDGPGGTGKTFLYRALLASVRSSNLIALATATSGVAASILPNGRTAHSRFKIPIGVDGKLTCNIGKQTDLAKLLRSTSLILWDEASMANKRDIEALDDMLRDITDVDSLFGGKVVVLGGDFRQVLPVIPRGTREDSVNASLVRSPIWPMLSKFRLKENMRAITDPSFSKYLLRIGDGVEPVDHLDQVQIPSYMLLSSTTDSDTITPLIDFVFPDLSEYSKDAMSMTNSAILTPKNNYVDAINDTLLSKFPGSEETYYSIDETVNTSEQGLYVDFLHSLTPNGLPPHALVLKPNCPIMLLRNINPSKGLCNGTRLICRAFEKHTIIAEIAVGEHKGDITFIPRIPLRPTDPKLYPVEFTRRQFPVRLCFAMTINKAQDKP